MSSEELRHLTPFAVEFRYDVLPGEEQEGLDKAAVRQQTTALRKCTAQHVGGKKAPGKRRKK